MELTSHFSFSTKTDVSNGSLVKVMCFGEIILLLAADGALEQLEFIPSPNWNPITETQNL